MLELTYYNTEKIDERIENSFSQLAEQFNINRVLAKSKWDLIIHTLLLNPFLPSSNQN